MSKHNEIKNDVVDTSNVCNDSGCSNLETKVKKKYYSNPGSPKKPNYKAKKDGRGRIIVEETGTFDDLYGYIQSFADSVDINVLIAKFRAGDDTALNQRIGSYLDTTDIPNNYRDILNMKLESEQLFNSLPIEIKQKFNNSVDEFIMSVGKEGFKEKLNIADKIEPIKKVIEKPIENPTIDVKGDNSNVQKTKEIEE